MRYTKWPKRAFFLVVLLAGLAVVADIVALQVAESRAGTGFARATAAERTTIDLGGFPFLPGLMGGRIRRVELVSRGMTGGGLRVARLEASMDDVRFKASDAMAVISNPHARRAKLTGANPSGRVEIVADDLAQFVRNREPLVQELRIGPSGIEVRFGPTPDAMSPPARFLPRIDRVTGKLVLQLQGVAGLPVAFIPKAQALEKSIDLPAVPKGMSTPDLSLGEGSFTIEAQGERVQLLAGEGGLRAA